jgi:hypothetical protein
MSRLRRTLLLPTLAVFTLLLASPASALPAPVEGGSGWSFFLEPLFRWVRILEPNGSPEGKASPAGVFAADDSPAPTSPPPTPPPSNQGWSTDPNG